MSLINEALKRAKQAHAENLPPRAPGPPLRPVEPEQSSSPRGFGALLPIGLAAVAVAGTVILFLMWKKDPASATATAPMSVSAKTPAAGSSLNTVEPSSAPAASTGANLVSVPVSPSIQHTEHTAIVTNRSALDPTGSSAGPTNAAVAPIENADSNHLAGVTPPPVPAPLKLQSIIFNPKRPSAMINGRILSVGDHLREFRVMSIRRDDVLLVGPGSTNLLSLEP